MKSLQKLMHNALLWMVCLSIGIVQAQSTYKERFDVGNDVLVQVNTSHTNIVFETWNQNKVEVYAFIDDKQLSEKEKEEIFDAWDLEVLGNSQKVVIKSNSGSLWGGIESMGSLKALDRMQSMEALKSLESLKELESLSELSALKALGDIDWNIAVPEVPELKAFPVWPFNDERPNVRNKDGYSFYSDNHSKSYVFDQSEYQKNKQAYVDKLNKKYNSKVSVKQVDRWLDDVDDWSSDVEDVMEDWGKNFGKEFDQKFGPEFEKKMEKWGEEFGKSMEAWGEAFGEKFGKEMEAWGESFGKDMEKWAEQFEKDADKWAEEFEKNGYNYNKQVQTDPNGNRAVIIQGNKGGVYNDAVKAKKTIIIKLPKGAKTDINVRHGEVKMADAVNIKATLNYSALTANSIDGGNTLIDASYAPVMINHWKEGDLVLKFVDDCRLNNVQKINVSASSSDVNINLLQSEAYLSGSFGNLFINKISDGFQSVDIFLENTDATVSLPTAAFDFYYSGKKSRFQLPASITLNSENKNSAHTLYKGYHKSKNSGKSFTINAAYSNLKFQK